MKRKITVNSINFVILSNSIVDCRNQNYNINKNLVNVRARLKYFPGTTSKNSLHVIDSTLKWCSLEIVVIHIGINNIINNNRSEIISVVLDNIKEIAEECKRYGAAKLFSEFFVTTWYSERVRKDIYEKLTQNICKANV